MTDGGDPCKIGIMHPAFRVGKIKLIEWVNEFLDTEYSKVEACADGAIYVQLVDSIWNLKDSEMKKVKWNSKSKNEWCDNWKIVQKCFNKYEITKPIDIAKITNGKFQDNLEIMQWFKHFHECKFSGVYDGPARRNLSKSAPKQSKKRSKRSKQDQNAMRVEKKAPKKLNQKKKGKNKDVAKEEKINALMSELEKANLTIEAVEKERNFYFGKLREIEILCQQDGSTQDGKTIKSVDELQKAILAIMYKTDDAGMMESPGDDDNEGDPDHVDHQQETTHETF